MRKEINQDRVRRLEVVGGASCFAAGILAALLGSLLTASGWILGAEVHPLIHAAGTALLIVAIPLILFAGFCLDWSERHLNKSDNDRDPGEGRASPEPIMISKEIKPGVEKAVEKQNKEISLVAVDGGDTGLCETGLDKSLKTRAVRSNGVPSGTYTNRVMTRERE